MQIHFEEVVWSESNTSDISFDEYCPSTVELLPSNNFPITLPLHSLHKKWSSIVANANRQREEDRSERKGEAAKGAFS